MREKTNEWSDSDPSFIRPNSADLINWARRLGLSQDQVRDAVDSGLIKPAGGPRTGTDARTDEHQPQERPDGNS